MAHPSLQPLTSPALLHLKEQLRAEPRNEGLKTKIREMDRELRDDYFRRLGQRRFAAWLLCGGGLLLILAGRQTLRLGWNPPTPSGRRAGWEELREMAERARWATAGITGCVLLGLGAVAVTTRTSLPREGDALAKVLKKLDPEAQLAADPPPGLEEMKSNWPRFLGATGNALANSSSNTPTPPTAWPTNWNPASGEGIAWKTPLKSKDFNSPIVWSNRVFIAEANEQERRVLGFDTANGSLVWEQSLKNVPGSPAQPPKVPEQTGFAASTMATDGRRVYAWFANGDLGAFSLDGKLSWSRNLGVPKNPYGHATSLAVWQGRIVTQLDQEENAAGGSRLSLLAGATGKTIWEKSRHMPASWATPIVVEVKGAPQILTLGVPWLTAYALADGAEIWKAECLAGEITPSPIAVRDTVIAVSPSDKVSAFRLDGHGDVTKSHEAWNSSESAPDITSPASDGERVFLLSTPGVLTCLDAAKGTKLWEQDLGFECNATPVVAGGNIYIFGKKGEGAVVAATSTYQLIARADLGEPVLASPAAVRSHIYVRTAATLFCLGAPQSSGSHTEHRQLGEARP